MKRRDFLATSVTALGTPVLPALSAMQYENRGIVRYPDPWIEVIDERFAKYRVGSAVVERLYTGTRWAEGPAWFGDGRYLVWSDIPNNMMLRWMEESGEVTVFRSPSNNSNGNTRDLHGRLITCERRQVTRTEYDGSVRVLLSSFQDKQLNSPNDVIVHPDGNIWFTDPGYGIMSWYEGRLEEFELPTRIYRLNPETSKATVMDETLKRPNGLCFSPDFKKLYVSDTGESPQHPIYKFDVVEGKSLKNKKLFYDMVPGVADGMRCDKDGNIWTSAGWGGEEYDGVFIIAPDGKLIGKIHLPEVCSNLCFGGVKKNRLFITASQSLYSLYVETQGA